MRPTNDIHTNDSLPGEVTISLSYPRGGGVPDQARLHVEESISGQCLIGVTLTADQFLSLLSGTVLRVTGATITATPERIGKRMQNISVPIRHGDAADIDADAERAKAMYLADGWHAVRIDRTNFGRRVVAYRWVDNDAS